LNIDGNLKVALLQRVSIVRISRVELDTRIKQRSVGDLVRSSLGLISEAKGLVKIEDIHFALI
jgi:hypothetical protein